MLFLAVTSTVSCKRIASYSDTSETNAQSSTSAPEESVSTAGSEIGAGDEDVIKAFNDLLDSKARSYQLISLIDENMGKISAAGMDILLEKLETVQKADREYYTNLLFKDDWQNKLNMIFDHDIEAKDISNIKDVQLKEIVTEIFRSGFKLIALEGSFYPTIDYEFLEKYSDNMSPEYLEYVNVMARESNEIFSRDAGLMISWDELAFRLINCEKFLTVYPTATVRKKAVGDFYMYYLVSYLIGQNNTPTYSYENNQVIPEVLNSYAKLISDYPDYKTTGLIKSYQEILAETGNTVNDSVFKRVDGIKREAVHAFNLWNI
jgi:hypothetical protein